MQMPGLLWGSLRGGVLSSDSGSLTAPLTWSYLAMNWGTPGARPEVLPGHTNQVESPCVTANEAPPESLLLSLIHISEPTRLGMISYAVFCLKKKKKKKKNK